MAQSFARGERFTLRRAVQRAAADPAAASYLRRISMPLFALNHGPSTSAEWRERIAKLQAEAEQAKRELGEARQARADADAPAQPALPIRSPQIVDQLVRRHEVGSKAGLNRSFRQGHAEMSFAHARQPQKDYVAGLVNESQCAQFPDLALIDGRLKAKLKLIEIFDEWQMRQLETRP